MYKRFDDGSEEEETTIDPDDLGLLERTEGAKDAVKLLKPLTRRSIKPTRLFQSEEQKRAREAEKAEEEVTDIEEQPSTDAAEPPLPSAQAASNNRRSKRTAAMKSAQTAEEDAQAEANGPETDEVNGEGSPVVEKVKKPKRSSPFDSWKRLKPGATASPVAANKGRKRTSTALGEDERSSTGKKLRNR